MVSSTYHQAPVLPSLIFLACERSLVPTPGIDSLHSKGSFPADVPGSLHLKPQPYVLMQVQSYSQGPLQYSKVTNLDFLWRRYSRPLAEAEAMS